MTISNPGTGSGSSQIGQVKHVRAQATALSGEVQGSRGAAAQGKIPKMRKVGSSTHGPTGSQGKGSPPPIIIGGESTTGGGDGDGTGATCTEKTGSVAHSQSILAGWLSFHRLLLDLLQGMVRPGNRRMGWSFQMDRRRELQTIRGFLGRMRRCQRRIGSPVGCRLGERFHLHHKAALPL